MRHLKSTVKCPCCNTPVVSESNSQFELMSPSNECRSVPITKKSPAFCVIIHRSLPAFVAAEHPSTDTIQD